MEIIAKEHGFHTGVLNELVKIRVHTNIPIFCLCRLTPSCVLVTNSNDLPAVLQNAHRLRGTSAEPEHAYFDLSHNDLPSRVIYKSIIAKFFYNGKGKFHNIIYFLGFLSFFAIDYKKRATHQCVTLFFYFTKMWVISPIYIS